MESAIKSIKKDAIKLIGITGQNGFIGTHLVNTISLDSDHFKAVRFDTSWFEDEIKLDEFVSSCDVIVHLAGLNRHTDPRVIYETNIALVNRLIQSLERTESKTHVLMASSTQEERDNEYGQSKKVARELLQKWADSTGAIFSGLIIPNVFGPFGLPYYNSVVATFCYQLTHKETPKIDNDGIVKLIYIRELVEFIMDCIRTGNNKPDIKISHTSEISVSGLLDLLESFKTIYLEKGEVPKFKSDFEVQLFNTFRSFIDLENYFPRYLTLHEDNRGAFAEVIRLGSGGQVSYSTTVPGITRGNHYHTRKIERFTVIKGKALIQLRKTGTDKVLNFYLDGEKPSYVDMPIWYTHNIQNIGEDLLYTIFWINEPYDAGDPDTWFEVV